MDITERMVDDVTILDIAGRMTLDGGVESLRESIVRLLEGGKRKLVLNLENVPYIDSAGLGEVVRTYATVSKQGGSLKLLNLTRRIEDLLSITKLLMVFDTFDSERDAVKSMAVPTLTSAAVTQVTSAVAVVLGCGMLWSRLTG